MASTEVRDLFESLSSEATLETLIAERMSEGLYLEYKMKRNRSVPDLDDSDAWQFSRALSGFANSDGGILLWGVEDKNAVAAKLRPITGAEAFCDRLKKSLINTTQPVVDGVLLESFPSTSEPSGGFVKCLIPASDKTPHRAMLAGREYFRRTTEGFYKLEHHDLEDMFGRRPRPMLVAFVNVTPDPGDDQHERVHFGIANQGRGIAKYAGFICSFDAVVKVVSTSGGALQNLSGLNDGRPVVGYTDNVGVVHPEGPRQNVGHALILREQKGAPLTMRISVYCENMRRQNLLVTWTPD